MLRITADPTQANAITHSGIFHADEVLATVILLKFFKDLTVFRTSTVPQDIDDSVIIYDIGMGKFDHHQKGGNGTRENGIPYASCGLIWKEYGKEILKKLDNSEFIYNYIDYNLIQGVDAFDNGVIPKVLFPAVDLSFSRIISLFNPGFGSAESPNKAFKEAVKFTEKFFDKLLTKAVSIAKDQTFIDNAIRSSKNGIMILERSAHWQKFLFSSNEPKSNEILFVISPSARGGYNWQCVPDKTKGSTGYKKPVPSSWFGLEGKAFQRATGIATARFCHPSGFIGAAETLDDTIAIVTKALKS